MPNIPLKPMMPYSERAIKNFGVCDIEARDWIGFLVIGFAYKFYEEGVFKEKRYEHFLNLREFCDFVFEDQNPINVIYAHFGGRYDFSFLLQEYFFAYQNYYIHKMIPRGSGLLCFSVSKFKRCEFLEPDVDPVKDVICKTKDGYYLVIERTIEFRDSSAMLPFGLASLTDSFGVEHKKLEIDYEKITEVTPQLLEYLEYDCWGLYECLEKYMNWPMIKGAGAAATMASQALRVFRTFIKKPISCLNADVDDFVRSSYFGGRTEIFKPFFQRTSRGGLLNSYDVNSLYPAVMLESDMPTSYKFTTQFYLENQMGFYDVEVTVPDTYIPVLGLRFENMEHRLIFPTGTFRGVWSTMELNYATTQGAKINKVYKGMIFSNGGRIFEGYISELYAMRKKSEKGSVENVLTKLLMNSLYGRFALNLNREQIVLDEGQADVLPHMEIPLDREGKRVIRLAKQEIVLENSFTNSAIAAWVTSGARVWMHKLIMKSPESLYYMDTDSLKTTHKYPSNNDELGKLKFEYDMEFAAFILPKTYMENTTTPMFKLYDDMGREIKDIKTSKKIVMKGFDKRKISKFNDEDFTSALEGDMRRLLTMNPQKFAPLRTALNKGKFLALLEEAPRQIRTRYNKRRVFKRAWAQVYDTEALHIKNGEITNLDKSILKKWKIPTDEEMNTMTKNLAIEAGVV